MNFLNNKLHGLALCFAIAVPAAYLGKLFPIIGAPVFAIILGLLMAGIPRSDIFQGGASPSLPKRSCNTRLFYSASA